MEHQKRKLHDDDVIKDLAPEYPQHVEVGGKIYRPKLRRGRKEKRYIGGKGRPKHVSIPASYESLDGSKLTVSEVLAITIAQSVAENRDVSADEALVSLEGPPVVEGPALDVALVGVEGPALDVALVGVEGPALEDVALVEGLDPAVAEGPVVDQSVEEQQSVVPDQVLVEGAAFQSPEIVFSQSSSSSQRRLLSLDQRRTIDLALRGSVEPWLTDDGYLFRDDEDGKIKYLKPSGNAVINVLEKLGQRLSDVPQGYFHIRESALRQHLAPKETRFERVFDPDDERNVPHHCFLPKGYIRVIKRGKRKGQGYCGVYNNARHRPATCEDEKSVRKSINSSAVNPYPFHAEL